MIPINESKLLNAFHIDDLLKEAEMNRLARKVDPEQGHIGDQVMNATGNILINAGNWMKSRKTKHSLN